MLLLWSVYPRASSVAPPYFHELGRVASVFSFAHKKNDLGNDADVEHRYGVAANSSGAYEVDFGGVESRPEEVVCGSKVCDEGPSNEHPDDVCV